MSILVHLASANDNIYWQSVFRILGIRRCHPLLPQAGIPMQVCQSPEGLVLASRYFWDVVWEGVKWNGKLVGIGRSDPDFPENYRLGLESLLNQTFSLLANSYGEAQARVVYHWSQRHFLDHSQIDLFGTWAALLTGPAFKIVPLPFSSERNQSIEGLVHGYFGADIRTRENQLFELAEKVQLSPIEQRMVDLVVTRPDDFNEVDLLQILEQVISREHSYRLWIELDKFLTDTERESFLWWGYEQAALINIPASDVRLPKRTSPSA